MRSHTWAFAETERFQHLGCPRAGFFVTDPYDDRTAFLRCSQCPAWREVSLALGESRFASKLTTQTAGRLWDGKRPQETTTEQIAHLVLCTTLKQQEPATQQEPDSHKPARTEKERPGKWKKRTKPKKPH